MEKQDSNQLVAVNLCDFDYTIYNGDSTVDFYLFCLKRHPLLIKYLPGQAWHFMLFLLKLETRTRAKSHFFAFLRALDDTHNEVNQFWESHYSKIKQWYLARDKSSDVIISASPEFLLLPAFNKLHAHTLIATQIDIKTGLIDGENCYGAEKVVRLKQTLPNAVVESSYTDKLADTPILDLAQKKYIVKGEKITELA